MPHAVTLALVNASVLTMQRDQPRAEAVAIAGDRVAAVGTNAEIRSLLPPRTQVVDCQGLTLLPGLNDAHCHLLGLARRLQDLDCGPHRAPSISVLQALVCERTAAQTDGSWVRGYGYDDLRLAERRHPNRWDLDAASPRNPVWLEHRSGHAATLNSLAIDLAGIHRETPDPPGGIIERDTTTGEPTGILFEMRLFLRQRLGNIRNPQDFEAGMMAAGQLLNCYGITSVQDAGADNGLERWRTLQRVQSDGSVSCRITMFAGVDRLDEVTAALLHYGHGSQWLRVGHSKIVLTLTSGTLHPSASELAILVEESHRRGFPVALHCIEEEAIEAAADVLTDCRHSSLTDRIEHCAEGTPPLVHAVKSSQAAVVTNPGFLYLNGDSYRANVQLRLLPYLYPSGALHRAGITVAFGSDAPVSDPNPWYGIYGAVTRCDSNGNPLPMKDSVDQTVSVEDALQMYTAAAASVEGTSREKGSIAPGNLADMVLLDDDPLSVEPRALLQLQSLMTIVGGNIVWSKI